jgi:hypothetical protein
MGRPMTTLLDLSTLDPDTRYTVIEIASWVRKGAENARQVAMCLRIDPDDERFTEAWSAALGTDQIRYTGGCCDGDHDHGCEVETPTRYSIPLEVI